MAESLRSAAALFLITAIAACAPARPEAPTPRFGFVAVADSLILLSDLNATHWGVEVYDPARDRLLYVYNHNRHFIPASNTKIVVSTVALGLLGPDFRYRTDVFASGMAGDSAVDQVIAVGSGDPTWSDRFYERDDFVLDQLADSITRGGARSIRELIIDASRFGAERVHSTWEVGDLPGTSAPPVGAFAFAEGVLRISATPGSQVGTPATLTILGPAAFPIRAMVRTDTAGASANLNADYQSWPDTMVITGRVGLNRPDTSTFAEPNAVRFAATAFAQALERKGVRVQSLRVVYDTLEATSLRGSAPRVVATWQSPPLSAIVAGIMQPSQNWIAEQLVKTLGALHRGRGSWSSGIDVERRYLIDVVKVDSGAFQLRDASGLSAQNLLTPHSIVQMLRHNLMQPYGPVFRQSLPSPGLRGGTLSSRLAGLEGRVFAKTGTITNVNSLSGYIVTASGRELIFSIMTNSSGRPSAQVRRGMDRLVSALAEERNWE